MSAGRVSPAGGAVLCSYKKSLTSVSYLALHCATFPVSGGWKELLPLSSHLHSKLVHVQLLLLQWNALSLTTGWVLHNLISLDKRKISGRKPLHTKLSGLDSKLSICQSMHATIWLDWKFAERLKMEEKTKNCGTRHNFFSAFPKRSDQMNSDEGL